MRCSAILLYFLVSYFAVAIPVRRQVISSAHGALTSPQNNTTINPGADFPFSYTPRNLCFEGYSPLTVWLLPTPPSAEDMTPDGDFLEDSYLYKFGTFLVANFGLPSMSTPPPATLAMPIFSASELGSLPFTDGMFYLTVVETFLDCPAGAVEAFGTTFVQLIYNDTDITS